MWWYNHFEVIILDKQTFKVLEVFYEFKKMSMVSKNNPLQSAKEEIADSYHYLLDNKYIEYSEATSIIKITIAGSSYVEEHRKNLHLIELQKQTVKNQTELKYCQYLLAFIAIINILHMIFS